MEVRNITINGELALLAIMALDHRADMYAKSAADAASSLNNILCEKRAKEARDAANELRKAWEKA